MPIPVAATEVLDREFLQLRARLIAIGAALDRMDRAEGSVAGDPRINQVGRALQILATETSGRAEKLQSLFSLPYQDDWRKDYGR